MKEHGFNGEKYLKIKLIQLNNFRGLNGTIEFGRGLNIIVGPNCSGKTAVIEALAHVLALNYTDLRVTNWLLFILHSARGSERHSIASLTPQNVNKAEACVVHDDSRDCISIEKQMRVESRGVHLVQIVELSIKASARECIVSYSLDPQNIGIGIKGKDCIEERGLSLGVVTPGILPFNFFDSIVGKLKREKPEVLEKLTIQFCNKKFKVDVASDEWDMLSAYITEYNNGDPPTNVSFYSIGRGLQRALLLRLQQELSDIILIDEIESAMHPELLEEISLWVAEAIDKDKQIILTTQSLEAARFLIAAITKADKTIWRIPYKLASYISGRCSEDTFSSTIAKKLSLIILRNDAGRLNSIKLEGCEALQYILGSEDIRMSYVLA